MTDFNVVPLNEPPYCRGIYKTFSGGWLKTKIARGSQRFLSVPFSKMRRFYFTTVSVYGSDAQTRVAIIDENGARQQLRRVFVKYRFPFLTQRADTGAYKSVHFKYGFAASTVTKAVQIENIHGAYPVCLVAPVKAGDAPVTIDDVIRDLDQLETTPAPRPTHDLARLETALRDLRAQDETQDVLQSLVRLYCLYQVNHGQNFRNFEDWSNGEKSRGNADVVQPFKDRLDTITAPLSLGRHGYIPSFKNLDLNTVENDLFDLMATVSSFGVKPFLNSGTLLGGGVISPSHDLPDGLDLGPVVAIDCETMGLRPHRDRLCLVQMSSGDGDCHLVQVSIGQTQAPNLVAMLENKDVLKLFHYGRFDIAALMHTFGAVTAPVYCTKIASRLVRTFTDRHGLRTLLHEMIGVDISKHQQQSDWGAPNLTKAQLDYAASDVLHLHKLRGAFDVMLEREGRADTAQACFDFLPTRAKLDLDGWPDTDIFAHS